MGRQSHQLAALQQGDPWKRKQKIRETMTEWTNGCDGTVEHIETRVARLLGRFPSRVYSRQRRRQRRRLGGRTIERDVRQSWRMITHPRKEHSNKAFNDNILDFLSLLPFQFAVSRVSSSAVFL